MNRNGKMSFGDFIFPVNPYLIRIVHHRAVTEQTVPFGDSYVGEVGGSGRIVSGEGEFFGENCEADFAALKAVFEKGGGGMLYLPSQKPFFALFEELQLEAGDLSDVIRYRFRFRESFAKKADRQRTAETADGRHCLWDYAWESGMTITALQKLNPDVKRPDRPVQRGRRVYFC